MGSTSKASPDMQRLQSIYKAGIYLLYKHAWFLSPEKLPSHEDFMPIRIRNPKTYNMVQQFLVVLLCEKTSYNISLLCQLLELKKNMIHLLHL